MLKSIMLGMMLGLLSGGLFLGTSHAVDYPQGMPTDYLYRSRRLAEPPAEKTFWDYLSFLAVKMTPEQGHEFPAAEAEELRHETGIRRDGHGWLRGSSVRNLVLTLSQPSTGNHSRPSRTHSIPQSRQ